MLGDSATQQGWPPSDPPTIITAGLPTNTPKTKCSEQRTDGQPCTAYATHTGKCAGHSKLGIAANPTANQTLAAQARRNKAELRKRTPQDHLQNALEARAKELVDSALNKASDGDISALRWAWEAVYGKPQERVQVQDSSDVRSLSPEARAELRRRALAAHPDLAELVPKDERPASIPAAEPNQAS